MIRPDTTNRHLDAQAAAFAQIIATTDDADAAFRDAAALAEGLFPHQIEGVAFLLGRRRAILADDMGLGKTRQAVAALRHAAPAGQLLVVCPASVKRNWVREIAAAGDRGAVHVIDGTRPQAIPREPRWVVINYDLLRRHAEPLGQVPWSALVFDEAHYLKNHTSGRSRAARDLASRASALAARDPAVFLLTGTPLTNRPRDLFVLLQLVGHPLGRSFLSFARRYCAAEQTEYGWKTDGAANLEELTLQLHGVMLRRGKDEVLSLPPKLRTWLPIPIPQGTGAREISAALKLLLAPSGRDTRARTQLLALLTKARQKLAIAKVEATRDLVESAIGQGQKVIVFSCFDEPLQQLARAFGKHAAVLTGKVPSTRRQALVDRFQRDDDVRVFLANIIAGGTGITLTAASQVVFNDLDWVPANHWQAEDRAYRIGQTQTVNVTYVVGEGTIDDFVQVVLQTKAALVRSVVEGEALTGDAVGNVLDELERALAAISPRVADTSTAAMDQAQIEEILRDASERARHASEGATGDSAKSVPDRATLASLRAALQTLARVLAGPVAQRYSVASTSSESKYVVAVDGADVTCTCPGFEYRGQCRHAREVKAAVASGSQPPASYVALA